MYIFDQPNFLKEMKAMVEKYMQVVEESWNEWFHVLLILNVSKLFNLKHYFDDDDDRHHMMIQ
jgi:hypothetical protein